MIFLSTTLSYRKDDNETSRADFSLLFDLQL